MKKILVIKSVRGLANNIESGLVLNFRSRGYTVVDYPFKERHYTDFEGKEKRYGWTKALLPINVDRNNIIERANKKEFDAIVLFDPLHQEQQNILDSLDKNLNIVIIDPYESYSINKRSLGYGPYYKREYFEKTNGVYPISFSFPQSVILTEPPKKTKLFAEHNQVSGLKRLSLKTYKNKGDYAFDNQKEYYKDLQISQYATTKKKNGWDCYRHYEIAMNGCVMCFYKLEEKPHLCAPHSLIDMYNCVSFNSVNELEEKINLIGKNNTYKNIQQNSLNWALQHSCEILYNHIL